MRPLPRQSPRGSESCGACAGDDRQNFLPRQFRRSSTERTPLASSRPASREDVLARRARRRDVGRNPGVARSQLEPLSRLLVGVEAGKHDRGDFVLAARAGHRRRLREVVRQLARDRGNVAEATIYTPAERAFSRERHRCAAAADDYADTKDVGVAAPPAARALMEASTAEEPAATFAVAVQGAAVNGRVGASLATGEGRARARAKAMKGPSRAQTAIRICGARSSNGRSDRSRRGSDDRRDARNDPRANVTTVVDHHPSPLCRTVANPTRRRDGRDAGVVGAHSRLTARASCAQRAGATALARLAARSHSASRGSDIYYPYASRDRGKASQLQVSVSAGKP